MQHDFIFLIEIHGIAYHEKKLGQLFCDGNAQDVIDMPVAEFTDVTAETANNLAIKSVLGLNNGGFGLKTSLGEIETKALVIATVGLSIPKIGESGINPQGTKT